MGAGLLLLLLGLPAPASATVSVLRFEGGSFFVEGDDTENNATLSFVTKGDATVLRIANVQRRFDSSDAPAVRLKDPSSPAGCAVELQDGVPVAVTCPFTGVGRVDIRMNRRNDTVDARALGVRFGLQRFPVRLPVFAQGGAGDDRLIGGAGADQLVGGDGRDVLEGLGGADTLIDTTASRGDEIILGGTGDDVISSGPGADIISGGAGLDRLTNAVGTVTLGDLLCNDGDATDRTILTFDRSRVVEAPEGRLECPPFPNGRDLIAGVEILEAGSTASVDFIGGPADEVLRGSSSGDVLEGGGGVDSLLGAASADLLLARDDTADGQLRCNTTGDVPDRADRAVVDAIDPVQPGCETIERGAAATPGPIGGGTPAPAPTPEPGPAPTPEPSPAPTPAPEPAPTPPPGPSPEPTPQPDATPTPTPTPDSPSTQPSPGTASPEAPPFPPPAPAQDPAPSSAASGPGAGGGGDPDVAPQLQLPEAVAFISRQGRISLRVRCVYRARSCVGRVTLRSLEPFGRGRDRVGRNASLGGAAVNVRWGTSRTSTFTAPRRLRRALAGATGRRVVRVRVTVTARDGGAGPAARRSTRTRVVQLTALGGRARTLRPAR